MHDWRADLASKDLPHPAQLTARTALTGTVLAKMRNRKLIADDVDTLEKLPFGPCFKNVIELVSLGTLATDGKTEQDRKRYRQEFNESMQQLSKGQCTAKS